ncbi:MAG TPA: alpha/beta family hydrolase [Acidimicrobiales bacterium]|nr:alpha/beta family hydrolase [Acidimicrobiales bacterium]
MKRPKGLLLTPGAGADRNQSCLVALDEALSAKGIVVERMDFPYRIAGRRAPDRAPVLVSAVRAGAAELARRAHARPTSLALGGRSMGGRICSLAVAEGLRAAALVLISYPLHPPGKPDQLRTEHFPDIEIPCLFVSGTRDGFGTPDELTKATKSIKGPVTHAWVEGGDHGLRRKDQIVLDLVASWLSKV